MNTNFVNAVVVTILAGPFLLASHALAKEEYDVKAFGPKNPIVWEKPVKVIFEHKVHTDDMELECSSCHAELFAMQRGVAPKTGKLSMASLAKGQFCGACHDGDSAFATDTNCAACHIIPKDPIVWTEPVKAVVFYHNAHTEDYELECNSCHNSAFTMKKGTAENSGNFTMKALYSGQYCRQCHDGDTAFASNTLCRTCHIGVKGYNRMMAVDPHKQADKPAGH